LTDKSANKWEEFVTVILFPIPAVPLADNAAPKLTFIRIETAPARTESPSTVIVEPRRVIPFTVEFPDNRRLDFAETSPDKQEDPLAERVESTTTGEAAESGPPTWAASLTEKNDPRHIGENPDKRPPIYIDEQELTELPTRTVLAELNPFVATDHPRIEPTAPPTILPPTDNCDAMFISPLTTTGDPNWAPPTALIVEPPHIGPRTERLDPTAP
jgi:hypothetical protein